jgi:predicted secreted protein
MSDPTAQDGSPHLTREQAVLLTSRLFAAYMLFWAIADFTAIPREILAITHYMKETASVLGINTSLPQTSYLQRSYILDLLASLLRITLWLMAAGWFYRCGPKISNFFFPNQPAQTSALPAQTTEP